MAERLTSPNGKTGKKALWEIMAPKVLKEKEAKK